MKMNKYLINSQDDIIILKHNLMETKEGTTTITESKDKNALNVGGIFEENVRETLINEYNFDESSFPRNVLFREIYSEDNSINKTILSAKNEIIKINNVDYFFQLNNNCSLSIFYKDKLIKTIKDKKDIQKETINDKIICFQHHGEVEVDGILVSDNNFKSSMFKESEVLMIYSNINIKEEETFQVMILEIKSSAEYLIDLIIQLIRDAKFFNRLTTEKIVFIGFVGSGTVDHRINFKELLGSMKCVIYLIKDNKLCGRNLKTNIDWTTVNRVKKLTKKTGELIKKTGELTKKIGELTKKIIQIDSKMNIIMDYLGIKIDDNEKKKKNQ